MKPINIMWVKCGVVNVKACGKIVIATFEKVK